MATNNMSDLIRRRIEAGYTFDAYREQENKNANDEEGTYSTGDEIYNFRTCDGIICKGPPPCDFCVPGYQQYGKYSPPLMKKDAPTSTEPVNQFEEFKKKFMNCNHELGQTINRDKVSKVTTERKPNFGKDNLAFQKNYSGKLLRKPENGHESDHSLHSNQLSEQGSSDIKAKRPMLSNNRSQAFKPSARSNVTSRSKKAEELMNLQRLKSDIIEVIQDGIQKIEKTTSKKPSRESQSLQDSATSVNLQSNVLNSFVKQLRDNHLENILHEVKNLHFLESLPERCQNNDINKRRES